MSNRKKSTAAQQYPLEDYNGGGGYQGEIAEATAITMDDYIGNYDELGEKKRAVFDPSTAESSSASPYNSNFSRSTSNGNRRASTQSSIPTNSFGSSDASSARRASVAVTHQPLVAANAETIEPVETTSYAFKSWPPRLRSSIVKTFTRPLNEKSGKEFMTSHHWPTGLQAGLIRSCVKFPMRYFIVDDSGSMSTNDGRRVAGMGPQAKIIQCTRWAELVSGLKFHVELAERLGVVSEVRILNGADPCIVGLGDDDGEGLQFAQSAFDDSPGGATPLCKHICAVVESLTSIADDLRKVNKKAVVIICTDGESTDGDVAVAMRPLKQLPVWVVLRLCTGETKVLNYWNDIDQQLELELDVIDDMISEANEVKQFNSWLTYGEPLQRYREFGAFLKELDLVDEQMLSGDQLKIVCGSLFMERDGSQFPHPNVDWRQFAAAVRTGNEREGLVFCSVSQKYQPWIVLDKAAKMYGAPSSGVCNIS